MPLQIPTKKLNDMDSYRRLEDVRRCSNKELTVTREMLEGIRSLKEYATLGKRKPSNACRVFQGWLIIHSLTKKRGILKFWLERVREMGAVTCEQLQLGEKLEERVIEPSIPPLEGQVCLECGSWDGPLKTSLVTMWELMKLSWCPHSNASLIWDLTAEIELEENDDENLHKLAMICHLLALKITRQDDKQPTEPPRGTL